MKKKAFTLMELLIVVVVIGVLAGIAIPKFSRVLETQRVNEAENILNAVRTEQEARCVMGKNYLGESRRQDLASLSNTSANGNYDYELLANGISAKRGTDYILKMWYKTGTLCCEGAGCKTLNKDYPTCGEAPANDECADAEVAPDLPPEPPEPPSCGEEPSGSGDTRTCNTCGTQTLSYECNESTWEWEEVWSDCTVESASQCKSPSCEELNADFPEGKPTCSSSDPQDCDNSTCYREVDGQVDCSDAIGPEWTIGEVMGTRHCNPKWECKVVDVRDDLSKCRKIETREVSCSDSNMLGQYFGGTGHAEVLVAYGSDAIISARDQEYDGCYQLVYKKTFDIYDGACTSDSNPNFWGHDPDAPYNPVGCGDLDSVINRTTVDLTANVACPNEGATCTVCKGHMTETFTCSQYTGVSGVEVGYYDWSESVAKSYWNKVKLLR